MSTLRRNLESYLSSKMFEVLCICDASRFTIRFPVWVEVLHNHPCHVQTELILDFSSGITWCICCYSNRLLWWLAAGTLFTITMPFLWTIRSFSRSWLFLFSTKFLFYFSVFLHILSIFFSSWLQSNYQNIKSTDTITQDTALDTNVFPNSKLQELYFHDFYSATFTMLVN